MTGLKDQCFGVEVEMTGITRKQAAQALADYFGTIPKAKGGVYDTWKVKDPHGQGVEAGQRRQHYWGAVDRNRVSGK